MLSTNNQTLKTLYFLTTINVLLAIFVSHTQDFQTVHIIWTLFYISALFSTIYYLLVVGFPQEVDFCDRMSLPRDVSPTKVVIFTDEGEECDDRLAIHYLLSQKNDQPIDFTFVFTGTAELTAEECLDMWFDKYNPETHPHWNRLITTRFTTLSDFKNGKNLAFDWALQIAPVSDYDASNLHISQKFILAGNADPSKNSINRKKSDAIVEKFQKEGKLMDICSDHMAKMRFQPKLLEKFKSMPNFMEGIVFFAFKLAIARMRYDHPVAAKGVAEGLVNPKKGRGTNYKSVSMIYDILINSDKYVHLRQPESCSPSAKKAAMKYFMDVYGENSAIPADSYDCLCQINLMLDGLNQLARAEEVVRMGGDYRKWLMSDSSKEGLFDHHPEVFYSDFDIDNIPELLQPMWELFKENQNELIPAFNPVYDLFAAFVLVGEMDGISRASYEPTEFVEAICQEF